MIRPLYVYRFRRHRTDGEGTRYDLAGWDGPGCYAPLACPLKRSGEPVVYVNKWCIPAGTAPDSRKGGLILAAPGKARGEKGRNLSSIFEPSPEHPGRGFGDLEKRRDAILTERNAEVGTLSVYVFPGLGLQAETLFLTWIDGGVLVEPEGMASRSLFNINKGFLDTDSVTDA
jgi:hypothetical protein